MIDGWKEIRLGDIIDIKHGYAFKGENFSDIETNIILLTPGNFKIRGGFKSDKFKFYKRDGEIPEDYILKERDLLVTMTDLSVNADTLGYPVLIPELKDILILHNQRTGKVILKSEEINRDYLYYLLCTREYRHHVTSSATGTTVKHTSPKRIESYIFKLPSFKKQVAIAHILSTLDEKIEVNNKINKTLEKMAQETFNHWFVDFEFPNKDGEPYKSSGGEMVESELGLIPKGWEVGYLKDILDLTNGYSFKSKDYLSEGQYKIITIKNVSDGKFINRVENYINELPSNIKESQILKKGDILLSLTGNVGRSCIVFEDNCLLNQRVARIQGKHLVSNGYAYFMLRGDKFKDKLITIAKGTAQQNLSPVEMMELKTVIPNLKKSSLYMDVLDSMYKKILLQNKENLKLETIRDTLLPKLMSGQIRVPLNIDQQ